MLSFALLIVASNAGYTDQGPLVLTPPKVPLVVFNRSFVTTTQRSFSFLDRKLPNSKFYPITDYRTGEPFLQIGNPTTADSKVREDRSLADLSGNIICTLNDHSYGNRNSNRICTGTSTTDCPALMHWKLVKFYKTSFEVEALNLVTNEWQRLWLVERYFMKGVDLFLLGSKRKDRVRIATFELFRPKNTTFLVDRKGFHRDRNFLITVAPEVDVSFVMMLATYFVRGLSK